MHRTTGQVLQAVPVVAAQQLISRTLPLLERRIDEIIVAKPEAVDLVLSAVQLVDSAGLNWILQTQARLETMGVKMRLIDPSPIMADVLLATRLDSRLTVETSTGTIDTGGATAG